MSPKRAKTTRARAVPDRRFGRICIGCGCCDTSGCPAGCSWRAVHPSVPVGVCSECPAYLPLFKRLDVPTAGAIYREQAAKLEEMS